MRSIAETIPWITEIRLPTSVPAAARLWRADLDQDTELVRSCEILLTADELERARHFRVSSAQRQFVLTRSALRTVLGAYVGSAPAGLRFGFSQTGKPFLTREAESDLQFNVSHSGNLALIAVAQGGRIGVDLELLQDRPDLRDIAHRCWAAAEWEALQCVPAAQWTGTFYRIWTRKEAVLKACGQGITGGLRSPDVSGALDCPGPEHGLRVGLVGSDWAIYDLALDPQYAAALAVEILGA